MQARSRKHHAYKHAQPLGLVGWQAFFGNVPAAHPYLSYVPAAHPYLPRSLCTALVPHRTVPQDTWVLGGVDEVLAVLEDSSVLMATILASRFVAGIR